MKKSEDAENNLFDPTTMADHHRLRYMTSLKNGCHIRSVNTPDFNNTESDFSDDDTYSFGHQIVLYTDIHGDDHWINDIWNISQSDILFVGEIFRRIN